MAATSLRCSREGITAPDVLTDRLEEFYFEGLSLPRRASVLQTLVQACDMAAISENLLPVPPNDLPE
ncbi:MAG TPA: hypothetical protein VE093_02020 [Polyangiaceae bacterium]|jgi:hypothetical protein|nr:hypothetical protein [Polyangiaceae bacterium]